MSAIQLHISAIKRRHMTWGTWRYARYSRGSTVRHPPRTRYSCLTRDGGHGKRQHTPDLVGDPAEARSDTSPPGFSETKTVVSRQRRKMRLSRV